MLVQQSFQFPVLSIHYEVEMWACVNRHLAYLKLSRTSGLERTSHCHAECLSFRRSLCPSLLSWPVAFFLLVSVCFCPGPTNSLFSLDSLFSLWIQFTERSFFTCLPVMFTHWPQFCPCGATQNKLAFSYFCLPTSTLKKVGTALTSPESSLVQAAYPLFIQPFFMWQSFVPSLFGSYSSGHVSVSPVSFLKGPNRAGEWLSLP